MITRRPLRVRYLMIAVLATLAATTGCSSTDADPSSTTPVSSVSPASSMAEASSDSQESSGVHRGLVEGIIEGSGGVLSRSEAECWASAIEKADLTLDQIAELSDDPLALADMPVVSGALVTCIDPSVDLDLPMTDQFRDQVVLGMTSQGITKEQGNCILDVLIEDGYDARDLTVAGLTGAGPDGFDQAMANAIATCVEN